MASWEPAYLDCYSGSLAKSPHDLVPMGMGCDGGASLGGIMWGFSNFCYYLDLCYNGIFKASIGLERINIYFKGGGVKRTRLKS